MGTKRIGLARVQALIENLKRELTVNGNQVGTLAGTGPARQVHKFTYDFASDGGATGEITLTPTSGLPRGFICTGGWIEVITAVTSGGSATVAVGTEGTSNDPDGFRTATAKAVLAINAICSFNGALTPTDASLGKKIITTNDPVSMTIATADLTAGKFHVYVEGYMSNTIV